MASLQSFLLSAADNMLSGKYINAQTGTTYELVIGDAGCLITLTNAGAITLTVPANADVAFKVGTRVWLQQLGAGLVTVAGDVGVTVNAESGLDMTGQYGEAVLTKVATDTWLFANLTTGTVAGTITVEESGGGSYAGTDTVVFSGASVADDGGGQVTVTVSAGASRNYMVNGDFAVAQRGTSFTSATTPANSDDTYLIDQWILLSDGNDTVDVTQETSDVPTGSLYAIALDVETANRKFGILQILEQKNCVGLVGEEVTVAFEAKTAGSGKLDNLKCAIIAWDGTADTVTSDIISAWGIEGTNPTLVANWTYENTPANLSPTTSWAEYSVTATVDTASTKNIGIFIWSDVTDVDVGDFLRIAKVRLAPGSSAPTYAPQEITETWDQCMRYFLHIGGVAFQRLGVGYINTTTTATTTYSFPVRMRTTPSASVSATNALLVNVNSADKASSAVTFGGLCPQSMSIVATIATDTVTRGCLIVITDSTGWVRVTAEL